MKAFYGFMLVCAVLGTIWTINAKGADGSPLAIAVPVLLGGGTALYYKRTRGNIWGKPAA